MALAINKTTIEIRDSVDPNTLSLVDWVIYGNKAPARPMTASEQTVFTTVLKKYWKFVSDELTEMTVPEKQAIDDAETQQAADNAAVQADMQDLRDTFITLRNNIQTVLDSDAANLTQANQALDLLANADMKMLKAIARLLGVV